jgi:hypothetical protein
MPDIGTVPTVALNTIIGGTAIMAVTQTAGATLISGG